MITNRVEYALIHSHNIGYEQNNSIVTKRKIDTDCSSFVNVCIIGDTAPDFIKELKKLCPVWEEVNIRTLSVEDMLEIIEDGLTMGFEFKVEDHKLYTREVIPD